MTKARLSLRTRAAIEWLLGLVCLALGLTAQAQEVNVAVAANFAQPMKLLAQRFEQESGYRTRLSVGATGTLYAQIKSGAPFDVLLAADEYTPARLENEKATVAGTRFTYATGRLVLWSARAGAVGAQGDVLKTGNFQHLALAAPKLSPYGAAAVQTLNKLALTQQLRPRWVVGQSVNQTYGFVASGSAELGFMALSQVFHNGKISHGSAWLVPADLHEPLRQDAVLLARAARNPAAKALLDFLKTQESKAVIRSFGYETS